MDWLTAVLLTLAIGSIVVTVVLGLKLAKDKRPTWAYTTKKIIGLGTDAPPELELTFSGQKVNEVFRTTLIVFNRGRQTILESDVTQKPAIQFEDAEILREPDIIMQSIPAIKFSATKTASSNNDSIEFSFLYLDHKDGAVVEVIHTECKHISCNKGNIIGAKGNNIVYGGQFKEASSLFLQVRAIVAPIVATIGILGIAVVMFAEETAIFTTLPVEVVLPFVMVTAVLASLGLSSATRYMPEYIVRRKFPSWTRDSMNEAAKLEAKGFPTEAYCFKCRAKKMMKNPKVALLKNGRPAVRGVCPDCGTKIYRIGPAEKL
ncbi:hypothetical protein ES703_40760 [subsurface metagenome]